MARGLLRLARPVRRGVLGMVARVAARGLTLVPVGRRLERFLLEHTWTARSAEMLDRYLVSGYQNPRVNVQSILLRHFLIDHAGGSGLDELVDGELRLAVELNEVLRRRAAELGVTMGSFLDPAKQAAVRRVDESIADREHAFAARWAQALGRIGEPRISVLELACGSANDYRAFVEFGLAPHLDYRGIDLTAKNVMNARRRFPDVRFEVGDVRSLPYGDREFDYVIASDVFEHLSLDGMELALDEAMRVARSGLALTFFNMGEAPDHEVRPTRLYHWNRLSRPRIEKRIRARFETVRVVAVAAWLRERYGYAHSYNRHAYSLFAEHPRDASRAH